MIRRILYTESAFIAMNVLFFAARATDAAFVAVILPLVFVVKKNADRAPVVAQRNAAALTDWLSVLYGIASHTLDCLYCFAVHRMGCFGIQVSLVLRGIMTKTTSKIFVTTGCKKFGLAFVVSTSFV
jgi:hypothetical protein